MEEKNIEIYGFDINKDILYFNARDINGIFSMDINTGIIMYEAISEKYQLYNGYLYKDAKINNGKIWFAPYVADDILIYDLESKACKYIEIPKLKGYGRNNVKFCGIYDYGHWFIMIPAEYPAILKVNKETYEIIVVRWEEALLKSYSNSILINKYFGISSWSYEVFDNTLYLFSGNISIKYKMNTDKLNFCQISKEIKYYSGIARYGDVFVLADRYNDELEIWNEEENRILDCYDLGHQGTSVGDDSGAIWLFRAKEGIIIAQAKDDFLRVLNNSGIMLKVKLNISRKNKEGVFYSDVKQKENEIIIPLCQQNGILRVNTDNWFQKYTEMSFNGLIQFKKVVDRNNYIVEDAVFYGLNDLIKRVNQCDISRNDTDKGQNIGRKIYHNVR